MDLISKVKVSDTSYEIKDGTARLAIVTLNNELNGKANKVSNATSGNFVALDSNGNLTDSGHKHSDYLISAPVTSVNGETGDVTIAVPSASTVTPQMDGTGAAGSASTYAKGDHVHPTDTSRKPAVIEVNHGTSSTTFTLTPNVLHTWGTVSSLNLTLGSGSATYVDEYMFKFTAGTGFTLTLPSTVEWYNEPQFNEGKTYEVSIVDGYACSTADIDMSAYAKVSLINTQLALKRDVIPIVSTTVASGGSLSLSTNTYYNITSSLTTATLVLPTVSGNYAESVILYFTTGNNPTITFSSSLPVYYTDTYSIEAGTTYEVNAMYNGSAWIIASGIILTS